MIDREILEGVRMSRVHNSVAPPDGEHYREMARGLRELARHCRFAGARRELLDLAASYERRADHFDCRTW